MFLAPWFAFSESCPYRWLGGHEHGTDHQASVHGLGDLSVAASFDALEWWRPTRRMTRCPGSGDWIFEDTDAFYAVQIPRLTLSAGLRIPTGRDGILHDDHPLPPALQPGDGCWTPSLGASLAVGAGAFDVSLGIGGSWPLGESRAGTRPGPTLALPLGVTWRWRREPEAMVQVSFQWEGVLDEAREDGAELEGTAGSRTTLGVAFSLRASTLWTVGVHGFARLHDSAGAEDHGGVAFGAGLFATLNLPWRAPAGS